MTNPIEELKNMNRVEFSELILGFSSAALYYIGHQQIEGKKTPEKNVELALQNISIIEMLQKKTQGNLTEEESKLLRHILTDLHEKCDLAK